MFSMKNNCLEHNTKFKVYLVKFSVYKWVLCTKKKAFKIQHSRIFLVLLSLLVQGICYIYSDA